MGLWPDKREMALYYLLKKTFDRRFNLGEALEVAKPYYPRKATLRIIKRLTKLGLLRKVGRFEYEIVDLESWMEDLMKEYLEARRGRYSSSSS